MKQYQQMNDQSQVKQTGQSNLDYIVSALQKKKKKNEELSQELSLKKLYQTMTNVVSNLDDNINSCKKYNQAKIHRKYQIMLNDQAKRIRFLQQKVKEQHRARSPSKQYVEDLLDKLIKFRFQNEALSKQNSQLQQQNGELKRKLQIYEEHVPVTETKQDNNNQIKSQYEDQKEQQITPEIIGQMIKNEAVSYLKVKNQFRKHQSTPKTKFQRFLKKNKDKLQTFTLRQFLKQIDKWSSEYMNEPATFAEKLGVQQESKILPPSKIIGLGGKVQIRSRKTNSFRSVVNNRSMLDNILR